MSLHSETHTASKTGARTSALLLQAVQGDSERISIGDILDAMGPRAFGLSILIFSLPPIFPVPPGIPAVVGVVLLIISFQMVIGRHELWLPRFLSKRSFARAPLISAMEKAAPFFKGIERVTRPRLMFFTGPVGTVTIGLVVLFMALILILPLPPGGHFPPALACAVLGMGLAEQDGVVVLLGWVGSVAATVAVWVVASLVIHALPGFWDWIVRHFGK